MPGHAILCFERSWDARVLHQEDQSDQGKNGEAEWWSEEVPQQCANLFIFLNLKFQLSLMHFFAQIGEILLKMVLKETQSEVLKDGMSNKDAMMAEVSDWWWDV